MVQPILLDFQDKDYFNPLFYKLFKTQRKYIISFGGRGSGKTVAHAQWEIVQAIRADKKDKHRLIIVRNELTSSDGSVLKVVKDILYDWGLEGKYSYNDKKATFTFHHNKAEIVFKSVQPDPSKLKGLLCSRIWIEEADQIDLADFQTLNGSLRGKNLKKAQLILTFNPTDETSWIKKLFWDSETYKDKSEIYHTTCLDNKFMTEADRQIYLDYKDYDFNRYRVEFLGEWGKLSSGQEVYKAFRAEKHVKDFEYDPSLVLHVSFDDNVIPYMPMGVFQIKQIGDETQIRMIDEIAIPDYNLEMVCNEFSYRFPHHKAGLVIYGDATAQKRDTKIEAGYNYFLLAQKYLDPYKPNLLINKANPSVKMRINFINDILYKHDKIKFYVHSRCIVTIKDFQYGKVAPDGTKDKKEKDKATGGQKHHHFTDLCDYLITTALQNDYAIFQGGNNVFQPLALGLRKSYRW